MPNHEAAGVPRRRHPEWRWLGTGRARLGTPARGIWLWMWGMLALAVMLSPVAASHAETTRQVRLVAEDLAPVELEVPERLISHIAPPPPKYRDTLLNLSFFLPVHADGTIDSADFQLSNIKGEKEQLASMGGSVSPADLIDVRTEKGIDVLITLGSYDFEAAFEHVFRQVGMDDSGQFEHWVSARNDGPSSYDYYRPVGSKDVLISKHKPPSRAKCSLEFTMPGNVFVRVAVPERFLPKWQELKALVSSLLVIRSPVRQP